MLTSVDGLWSCGKFSDCLSGSLSSNLGGGNNFSFEHRGPLCFREIVKLKLPGEQFGFPLLVYKY